MVYTYVADIVYYCHIPRWFPRTFSENIWLYMLKVCDSWDMGDILDIPQAS